MFDQTFWNFFLSSKSLKKFASEESRLNDKGYMIPLLFFIYSIPILLLWQRRWLKQTVARLRKMTVSYLEWTSENMQTKCFQTQLPTSDHVTSQTSVIHVSHSLIYPPSSSHPRWYLTYHLDQSYGALCLTLKKRCFYCCLFVCSPLDWEAFSLPPHPSTWWNQTNGLSLVTTHVK